MAKGFFSSSWRIREPYGGAELSLISIPPSGRGNADPDPEVSVVKPPNILLTNPQGTQYRILLSDFGIAHQIGEASGLTATNKTVGTVSYAAPEQLMGLDIDGRTDQYALAATAYPPADRRTALS